MVSNIRLIMADFLMPEVQQPIIYLLFWLFALLTF